ncbi:PRC-barrel domain-containing protein [Caloramator sp. E03]|uniref:PRC-barrel domain-containing protein n=1 Tax=Caloramator sp. E03 TaxID=2576307 RepID=UPI00143D19D9|nr:PRC-barrel domain-containing protein [Caloramator sp. E03]
MKKYLDVRGCSVVDKKGNIIGRIEDFLIDINKLKIYSFIITTKNIFPTFNLLLIRDVEKYEDVIVIKNDIYKLNQSFIKKYKYIMLQNFMDKEIIDINGKRLGALNDLIFDEFNGELKALICKRGFYEDIFEGRKIIIINEKTVFGKEKIIVDEDDIDITNIISFKNLVR